MPIPLSHIPSLPYHYVKNAPALDLNHIRFLPSPYTDWGDTDSDEPEPKLFTREEIKRLEEEDLRNEILSAWTIERRNGRPRERFVQAESWFRSWKELLSRYKREFDYNAMKLKNIGLTHHLDFIDSVLNLKPEYKDIDTVILWPTGMYDVPTRNYFAGNIWPEPFLYQSSFDSKAILLNRSIHHLLQNSKRDSPKGEEPNKFVGIIGPCDDFRTFTTPQDMLNRYLQLRDPDEPYRQRALQNQRLYDKTMYISREGMAVILFKKILIGTSSQRKRRSKRLSKRKRSRRFR